MANHNPCGRSISTFVTSTGVLTLKYSGIRITSSSSSSPRSWVMALGKLHNHTRDLLDALDYCLCEAVLCQYDTTQ